MKDEISLLGNRMDALTAELKGNEAELEELKVELKEKLKLLMEKENRVEDLERTVWEKEQEIRKALESGSTVRDHSNQVSASQNNSPASLNQIEKLD